VVQQDGRTYSSHSLDSRLVHEVHEVSAGEPSGGSRNTVHVHISVEGLVTYMHPEDLQASPEVRVRDRDDSVKPSWSCERFIKCRWSVSGCQHHHTCKAFVNRFVSISNTGLDCTRVCTT
jgi:hypothetical protein